MFKTVIYYSLEAYYIFVLQSSKHFFEKEKNK